MKLDSVEAGAIAGVPASFAGGVVACLGLQRSPVPVEKSCRYIAADIKSIVFNWMMPKTSIFR